MDLISAFNGGICTSGLDKKVRLVIWFSVFYMAILSMVNSMLFSISTYHVALAEIGIYGCVLFCLKDKDVRFGLAILGGVVSYQFLLFAIRGDVDLKGIRDILIPILFFLLGSKLSNVDSADETIKKILAVVILVGLFEVIDLDSYSYVFNTFSFYEILGHASLDEAMFEGQMLTLNGFRPEDIGRTIFPGLLEAHRASSILLEPVSLGNFSVILFGWYLSKDKKAIRENWMQILGCFTLIAISDSRFALISLGPMLLLRIFSKGVHVVVSRTFPVICFCMIIFVAAYFPGYGDNFIGRLTASGEKIIDFDLSMWFGVSEYMPSFGDMGYAYIISRFGIIGFLILFLLVGLVRTGGLQGERFKSYLIMYASMILMISGTSFFALKTAGIAWYMLGVLSKYGVRK